MKVKTNEYFIVISSRLPQKLEQAVRLQKGKTPQDALNRVRKQYRHPMGMEKAQVYKNADSYYKHETPLLLWEARKY